MWMFETYPEDAFTPRPDGRMRLHGGKGSSAPAPDPALIAAQIKSMGYQDSAIQQIMKNSEEMAPLQKEQLQFGLDTSKTAYKQSQEDRNWTLGRRDNLTTLQNTQIKDAQDFNSESTRADLESKATADVNSAFSSAQGQLTRGLSRSGINLSGGKALARGNQTAIAQAAAQATASHTVRAAARAAGSALTDRATNTLSGYPAMGLSTTSSGATFGSSGVGLTGSSLNGLNSGLSTASGAAGSMGSNATGMFGAQASFKNSQDQIATSNDPMNSILGAAAGVGSAYALKKFG